MPISPKEIEIDGKKFILCKFPAVAGREIIAKYPLSGLPKIGDYQVNEETMFKLMSYVAVPVEYGDKMLFLTKKELIDNHVPSWETLMKLEAAMLEYNCSFFRDGSLSNFLNDIVAMLPQWIVKTLTDLSRQSSQTEKPVSLN